MMFRTLAAVTFALVPTLAFGQAAASGTDLDDEVKRIYDGNLPPLETAGPVAGREPEATRGLDVKDRRGVDVAKSARFTRHDGIEMTIGDLLADPGESGPPVLLMMNYSRCPMLCGRQQRAIAEGLAALRLEPGEEYRFVSVSIDPQEHPDTADATRKTFVRVMNRPQLREGIDFFVGDRDQIEDLAASIGFEYRYDPELDQYAHGAVMVVLTPDGIVSRYLNGLYGESFDQKTLRLSLVEASGGSVSSVVDRLLLTCYSYDNTRGKYTPVATGILRVGAAVTVLALLCLLVPVWWKTGWRRPAGDGYPNEGQVTSSDRLGVADSSAGDVERR